MLQHWWTRFHETGLFTARRPTASGEDPEKHKEFGRRQVVASMPTRQETLPCVHFVGDGAQPCIDRYQGAMPTYDIARSGCDRFDQ